MRYQFSATLRDVCQCCDEKSLGCRLSKLCRFNVVVGWPWCGRNCGWLPSLLATSWVQALAPSRLSAQTSDPVHGPGQGYEKTAVGRSFSGKALIPTSRAVSGHVTSNKLKKWQRRRYPLLLQTVLSCRAKLSHSATKAEQASDYGQSQLHVYYSSAAAKPLTRACPHVGLDDTSAVADPPQRLMHVKYEVYSQINYLSTCN